MSFSQGIGENAGVTNARLNADKTNGQNRFSGVQ
jgi:hypothetical protein